MAKSSRSSTRKENNRRLASTVFGPAETARAQRLSAKLLELAKQPKPQTCDTNMQGIATEKTDAVEEADVEAAHTVDATAMDVDEKRPSRFNGRKRIGKRNPKKASITFPKYSDRVKARKNKKKT